MKTNTNTNPKGGFNPDDFLIVPARSFEELKIGEILGLPAAHLQMLIRLRFKLCPAIITRFTMMMFGQKSMGIKPLLSTGFRYLRLQPQVQPCSRM